MRLLTFLSCWGNKLPLCKAIDNCRAWNYDGVEGPVPMEQERLRQIKDSLDYAQIPYIAEIATGGGYVPKTGLAIQDHLDDFEAQLACAVELSPIRVNVLGGSDRWDFADAVDFFTKGIELTQKFDVQVCWETHRSRPTFHPWITGQLLRELPKMRITCDFSHWCVVTERLVMDEEPDILQLCGERADHVHARVGYDQGPQIPDPRDPMHHEALDAHKRWWEALWTAHPNDDFTVTPEFGPDGYLQQQPFTAEPAADLCEINLWMARELRSLFSK